MSHTAPIVSRLPLIALALLIAGCGGSGGSGGSSSTASAGSVRLSIAAPGDMSSVRDGSVQISGTVRPARATVTVRGRKATANSSGAWSASVGLEPGVNVVDVLASSGNAKPALTAIRIRRIVDIEVPDVTGLSSDDAKQQIQDAHLSAKTETDNGSFFDDLLGGSPSVCSTDPPAGASVDPGTTITIHLAHRC